MNSKLLTLILAVFPILVMAQSGDGRAHDQARRAWLAGYHKMEAADKLLDHRDYPSALQTFRDAKQMFETVQRQHPRWNPSMLQYRIDYCRKRVARLEAMPAASRPVGEKPQVSVERQLAAATAKLIEQQSELKRLTDALTKARAEAARLSNSTHDTERLAINNRLLTENNAMLTKKAGELFAEIKRLKEQGGVNDALLKLRQEEELSRIQREKLADSQRELVAERDLLKRQIRQLSLEREDAVQNAAGIESKLKAAGKLLTKTETELGASLARYDQLKLQKQQQAAAWEGLEKDAKRKAELLKKREAELAKLRRENAELAPMRKSAAKVRRLEIDLAETASQMDAIKAERDAKSKSITQLQLRITQLEAGGDTDDTAAVRLLKSQLVEARAALARNEVEFTGLEKRFAALQTDDRKQAAHIGTQGNDLLDARAEIEALRKEMQASTAVNTQLREKTAAGLLAAATFERQLKDARIELDALQKANHALRSGFDQANERGTGALASAKSVTVRNIELENRVRSLEGTEAELRGQVDAQIALNRALRDRLKAVRDGKPVALAPVVPREETDQLGGMRRVVEQLESKLAARNTTIDRLKIELLNQQAGTAVKPAAGETGRIAQLEAELQAERDRNARLAASLAEAGANGGSTKLTTEGIDQKANVQVLLARAARDEADNNIEAARWNYKRVLELNPNEHQALLRMGNILTESGDFEAAERYLMRAFYDNPDAMDILLPLGFLLSHRGKADMAVSMLSRAVALYPDNPDFHRYLGVACQSLGWRDAAEVQFTRSFDLDKSSADTAYNLAVLYAASEPPALGDARKWYDTAKQLGAASDPGLERLLKD
jgi:Tfp pilus assembly protein PilF